MPMNKSEQTFALEHDVLSLTSMTASGCTPCELAAQQESFATDTDTVEVVEGDTADTGEEELPKEARWEGIIGVEGEMTGDGRFINKGALRWQDLPIPFRYVASDVGAHDGAQVAGTIDEIKRLSDGSLWGTGPFNMQSEVGREAYRQVKGGYTTGVSMDLDDVTFEVHVAQELISQEELDLDSLAVDEEGRVVAATLKPDDEVAITTDGRIRAATIVAIPAFAGARISVLLASVESGDYCVHTGCKEPATLEVRLNSSTSAMYCEKHGTRRASLSSMEKNLDAEFGFNPGQARAPNGQWIDTPSGILASLGGDPSGKSKAPASGDDGGAGLSRVVEVVREQGGASINPITYEQPVDGYMVAVRGFNQEIPEGDFFTEGVGEKALLGWIIAHEEPLSKPGAHIGLWHDTANGEVVLDVSEQVANLDQAVLLGKERNQQSIWDVVNQVEIPTGGTGDRDGSGQELSARRTHRRDFARRLLRDERGGSVGIRARSDRSSWTSPVRTFASGPGQARAPKGTSIGGQWIDTPSGLLWQVKGATVAPKRSTPINPTSLGESIVLGPSDIEKLRDSPLSGPHIMEDGTFTPERQALHDEIVASYLDGVERSQRPTMFMNGGGPGSGKSTLTKGVNAKLTNYPTTRGTDDMTGALDFKGAPNPGAVLIDPDSVKAQLPEVHDWRTVQQAAMRAGLPVEPPEAGWANASHEESSYLSKRIYRAATDRGLNVVYDGTGDGSVASVMKKVEQARSEGYRVEANYLYLEPTEGLTRAAYRAGQTGRNVPSDELRHIYKTLPGTFEGAVIEQKAFDVVRIFDNNVARGEDAKLIGATNPDTGVFEVIDQGAYDAFKSSPERMAP